MPIYICPLEESEVIRDSSGRVIAYTKTIRGRDVWVPVPPRYLNERVTFPQSWLTDITPLLEGSK